MIKKTILTAALLLNLLTLSANDNNILCADIGGTRIKAAILHPAITLKELREVVTLEFPTDKWLSASLPSLFETSFPDSLVNRFNTTFQQISFAITGPIQTGSLYLNNKRGIRVPYELKAACEEKSYCPVFVENDAVVWSRGYVYWKDLIQQEISYPCLTITLGTGVGVCLLKSADEQVLIEIAVINSSFERLQRLSEDQPIKTICGKRCPHNAMGRKFFTWIRESDAAITEEQIQDIYNERIAAFLMDMKEYLETELNVEMNSVAIGGGNNRFLFRDRLENYLMMPIDVISPQYLAEYRISPDIISLLGCLNTQAEFPTMIPTLEECYEILLKDHQDRLKKEMSTPQTILSH